MERNVLIPRRTFNYCMWHIYKYNFLKDILLILIFFSQFYAKNNNVTEIQLNLKSLGLTNITQGIRKLTHLKVDFSTISLLNIIICVQSHFTIILDVVHTFTAAMS